MKKAILIILVIITLLIAVSGCSLISYQVNGSRINRRHSREIRTYLEEKYEEEFRVHAQWHHFGGGFWWTPDIPETVYFYAYPLSDPNYVFRVHTTREMPGIRIVEIRDLYYWRFLRAQLVEFTEAHFADILGDDMKVDITPPSSRDFSGLPSELNHNASLEDFFSSNVERGFNISISIFIPRYDAGMKPAIVERARTLVMELAETGHLRPFIQIYYVDDISIYQEIDTSVDEVTRHNYGGIHGRNMYVPAFWTNAARILPGGSFGAREIRERRSHLILVHDASLRTIEENGGTP